MRRGLTALVLTFSMGIFGSSCKNWDNNKKWLLMPDDVDNFFKGGEDTQTAGSASITQKVIPQGGEYAASSDILVPLIDYSVTDGTFNAGEQVSFNGQILAGPNPQFLSFRWDFGDGSPVTQGQNSTHTYATKGTYSITLTVTNDIHTPSVEKIVRKDIVIGQ